LPIGVIVSAVIADLCSAGGIASAIGVVAVRLTVTVVVSTVGAHFGGTAVTMAQAL